MKMRAAVLRESGLPRPYSSSRPLSIEEVDLEAPREGEVLIQIKAVGLCHSDLVAISGERGKPMPIVIGHEAAGIIENWEKTLMSLRLVITLCRLMSQAAVNATCVKMDGPHFVNPRQSQMRRPYFGMAQQD